MAKKDLKSHLKGLFSDIGDPFQETEQAKDAAVEGKEELPLAAQVALSSAKLNRDTIQFPPLELSTVAKICDLTATVFDIDELLHQAALVIKKNFMLTRVHIYLLQSVETETQLVLRADTGAKDDQTGVIPYQVVLNNEQSLAAVAAKNQKGEICNSLTQAPVIKPPKFLKGVQAELAVPMLIMGKAIGILDVFTTRQDHFRLSDIVVYRTIAAQIVVAVQNIRLLRDIEEQAGHSTMLNKMGETLNVTATLDEIQKVTAQYTPQILNADHVSIAFFNKDNNHFDLFALQEDVGAAPLGVRLPAADTLLGQAIEEQTLVVVFGKEKLALSKIPGLDSLALRSMLVAPLISGKHVIGTLNVGSKSQNAYSSRDENLMLRLSGYLASTIENRKLFDQIQAALAETELLYEASADLNLTHTYDDILAVLRQYTMLGDNAHNISLNYFDQVWTEDQLPEWVHVLTRWTELPVEAVSSRYALSFFPSAADLLEKRSPTIIEDIKADPRLDDNLRNLYVHRFQGKSTIFIPMVAGGQWIGYINAIFGAATTFPDDEVRRLMALAGQAAVVTQNLHIYNLAEQQTTELTAINRVQTEVSRRLNLEQILQTVYEEVRRLVSLDGFFVALYDPSKKLVSYPLLFDEETQVQLPPLPLSPASNLAKTILSAEPTVVHFSEAEIKALAEDKRAHKQHSNAGFTGQPAASLLYIPLQLGTQVIGAISVQSYQYNAYTPRDVNLLGGIANQVAVAIDNARLLQTTQQQAADAAKRETYQKGVAQAVAALTEQGTQAIDKVLAILGEVTQTSRTYYVETLRDEQRIYWRQVDEWRAPDIEAKNGVQLQRIMPDATPHIKTELQTEGWMTAWVKNMPDPDRTALEARQIRSILLLAVPGNYSLPGFIGFDENKTERTWAGEELAALQTAADALTNTLAKENLLKQIRSTLDATETLYQASRTIGEADSTQNLLRGAAEVAAAFKFDSCSIALITKKDATGRPTHGSLYRYQIVNGEFDLSTAGAEVDIIDWDIVERTLSNPEYMVVYKDSENMKTSMSEDVREILRRQKLRGAVVLGLTSHTQPLGFLIFGNQKPLSNFAETQTRQMRTVADQIVISLENQLLFERTEEALAAAKTLYSVSQRINVANNLKDILTAIIEEIPIAVVKRAILLTFERDSTGEIEAVTIGASWSGNQSGKALAAGKHLLRTQFSARSPFFGRNMVLIENARELHLTDLATLDDNNTQGMAVFPLLVGTRHLGTLLLQTDEPYPFTQSEVQPYLSLMPQIATSVENQRLLLETRIALKEVEATQRRYTQQAWEAYQATRGVLNYEKSKEGISLQSEDLASAINRAIALRQPVVIENGPYSETETETNSLIVPLTVRDEAIGVLGLQEAETERAWLPEEIELIEAVAAQFSQVAEELRLLDETQRRAAREVRINEIGDKIQAAQSLEEALQIAVKEVGLSLQAPQTKVKLGELA